MKTTALAIRFRSRDSMFWMFRYFVFNVVATLVTHKPCTPLPHTLIDTHIRTLMPVQLHAIIEWMSVFCWYKYRPIQTRSFSYTTNFQQNETDELSMRLCIGYNGTRRCSIVSNLHVINDQPNISGPATAVRMPTRHFRFRFSIHDNRPGSQCINITRVSTMMTPLLTLWLLL